MRKCLFTASLLSSTLFLLPAAAVLAPAAAWAQPLVQSQEGIALQNEIDQLQQQVQQLQAGGQGSGGSALTGGSPPPAASGDGAPVAGGVVTNLLMQVQQLQSQVQALNGKVDELQNEVTTQNAQTQKQIGDLNFKVTGSATPGVPPVPGAAPGAVPDAAAGTAAGTAAGAAVAPLTAPAQVIPAQPAPAAASAAVPADNKSQLHAAIAAYQAKNYTTSAAMAAAIVKKTPQAPEAYRAQYLVAQSYAAAGHNQDAAIAYDNTYNMNRTGTYAPQSLLGLAASLAGIGANAEACSTLSSLNSQFPTPPAGMAPRIAAVSKQASCQ
jgi:TolA-binding protein